MLNRVPLIICDDANSDDDALISAISEKWGFPVVSSSEKPSEGCFAGKFVSQAVRRWAQRAHC